MAKYTIHYACGHGSYEKSLHGKNTERERYIAWAERNMLCPECYKAKARAEDEAAEPVASLHTSNVEPVLIIKVKGKTERNKDKLYELGFSWQKISTGALGLLDAKEPPTSLAIVKTIDSMEQGKAWLADIMGKLAAIGYRMTNEATILDLSWMTKAVRAREAALAANPKPTRPDWYQAIRDTAPKGARWNGKVYGRPGNWRIYIADVEHRISDAQKVELMDYMTKFEAYRKAKEAL